jgi:hypothetical protein
VSSPLNDFLGGTADIVVKLGSSYLAPSSDSPPPLVSPPHLILRRSALPPADF